MSGGGQVALWYMRYHSPGYELCDSERDAAGLAWGMLDGGGAAVEGIQFPDGRIIRIEEWELYAEVEREYEQAYLSQPPRQPAPQRGIRDPFGDRPLSVDASEPAWLGRPARDAAAPALRDTQGGGQ